MGAGDPTSKPLLAYAVCAQDWCQFSAGYEDIREAPATCPRCGNPLHTLCPRCGMLFRTRIGICTNCGESLHPTGTDSHPTGRPR